MWKKIFGCLALPPFLLLLMLARSGGAPSVPEGLVPGPDIVVGDMAALFRYGESGTQAGLGMTTTVCNAGNVQVDFIPLPSTHHQVIVQNLYRMSGGSSNDQRLEQLGHAWVKHTFGSANSNECGFGCTSSDFTYLGAGCSDTYVASQNAAQGDLGSRAWINPFTGVFPSNARQHLGHIETGTSHRILVESDDVNVALNPGATYYAETQYVGPDEYAWCQAHPGQCNLFNNVSFRQFALTGNASFAAVGSTVRMAPALNAWPGATINPIEPEPGIDGRAFVASKVTGPVAGVWHYEYALYNMNLDRGIQSFSVPLGGLITVSNPGFHAPPNHPGFANDGTQGDAGYSNAAWTSNQSAGALSWSSETFVQNQNANAIRWGTLYNFRFDSNRPPAATNATIGFFKTGTPVVVAIQGPDATNATPTPVPTPTPGITATPTPSATPTPIPSLTPSGSPAQTINLSTRMRVGVGINVGIAGFILTTPTAVVIRALGPSLAQAGVGNAISDPILQLQGSPFSGTFVPVTNDNWRDNPAQEKIIQNAGLAPNNEAESAIYANLRSGHYTAIVQDNHGATGTALVEIYMLNFPSVSLSNVSTRALVATGDDVVIAGFILGGSSNNGMPHAGPDRIVVRGIGPSLASAVVPNPLADPTLELRNSNGGLLMANNNWQENSAQAAELTAAGLAPTHQLESALAVTLPPGPYTALLSGANNGTGIGLVEVYDRGGP